MKITDPISDFLTRIRNAQRAKKDIVIIPASKIKIAIAHLMKEEGFIKNYRCIKDNKQGILKIFLKYNEHGEGVIRSLQRVSKLSKRVYVRANKIPYVKNGLGVGIISTSKGIMTDNLARKLKIGGEYICSIF